MTERDGIHREGPADDSETLETLRLEVHPSVVFKLGADLVTDDMQALIELVKNSYDADASKVRVAIDTQLATDSVTGEVVPESSQSSEQTSSNGESRGLLRGRIVVSDDGTGMNLDAIRRGWLTVSSSHKHAMKERGDTTVKNRTPLGDKGLGRLGAQRLGEVITLTTRERIEGADGASAHESAALRVTIRWSDFATADRLSAVPITIERLHTSDMRPGTTLEIRGLREPSYWRQDETDALQRELATMISPYEGVSGFRLSLTIDGKLINLREKARTILDAAPVTYSFKFDGQSLSVDGRFALNFLRPQKREDIAAYDDLVGRDNGFAFAEWLFDERRKNAHALGVQQGDDRHFVTSHTVIQLDDVKDVAMQNGAPVSPGPFSGEVSGIPLDRDTTNVFDRNAEYREFVKALVGIKVYRDGFGVRVDDDWLGLGSKWTSGSSYYSLRPGNVIGYVSISARDNTALEETTNREAFRDGPAFRNFYALLTAWADYTGQVQEYLRRSYNDFKGERLAKSAEVEPRTTPENLVRQAKVQIEQANALIQSTVEAKQSIQSIRDAVTTLETQSAASETALGDPSLRKAVEQMITQVNSSAGEAEALVLHMEGLAAEHDRAMASLDLLSHQMEIAQSQIGDAWESVALGLSAEALAHEVQHISEGLRGRSAQITQYLKSIEFKNQRVWTFVEHVRSSASALSKQTSRLTPSLRFVRERRVDIRMSSLAAEVEHYYTERWSANGLQLEVLVTRDFSVRMNKGRLTQVFDNLILNSEYWLLQQMKARKLEDGRITIEIDEPNVIVRDNGLGVDPSIEDLAFDPFVTLKPSQQGRGLGLFVVRQLLDAEQSSISLGPERNAHGRRYEFLVNLTGVVSGESTGSRSGAISRERNR